MKKELAKELIEFINESPTAYHGAHTVKSMLDNYDDLTIEDIDNIAKILKSLKD